MRILALSDTHGNLDLVNEFVSKHEIDIVLHCGDFGFQTTANLHQAPKRELYLRVKHSPVFEKYKPKIKDMTDQDYINAIKEHKLLGDYEEYLQGKKKFDVPVYAIWGNHEENNVIERLITNQDTISNLNILHPDNIVSLEIGITLAGIGGNIIHHRFFNKPSFKDYYPYMTFLDWIKLKKNLANENENNQLWLLTHVSPGKEPFLEVFSMYYKPKFWFSGHMGAPLPNVYSLFTFEEDTSFAKRSESQLLMIKALFSEKISIWQELSYFESISSSITNLELGRFYSRFGKGKQASIVNELKSYMEEVKKGKEVKSPFPSFEEIQLMLEHEYLFSLPYKVDYNKIRPSNLMDRQPANNVKGSRFINLPDAYEYGYAILEVKQDQKIKFESYGQISS